MFRQMRPWGISLQTKLLTAFGALAALVVTGGVLAMTSSAQVKSRHDLTTDAARRIHLSDEIDRINAEILGAEKDMILGGLTANQPLLDRSTTRLQELVTAGGERTAALAAAMKTPEDLHQADLIRSTMDRVSTRCDECHAVVAAPGGVRANIVNILTLAENSETLLIANRANVQMLQQRQQAVFNRSAADSDDAYRRARMTSLATGALALGVALAVFLGVRQLTRQLRRTAESLRAGSAHVHAAADAVTTSSRHLSGGAVTQAASLQETSASMEEMSAMTKQNAEHAARSAGLVEEVTARAAESDSALHRMEGSMEAIQHSALEMSRIMKTIDEIAFQTNILALNAAVEAARAGDVGLGFAVVADEVRTLAQRSASAAKDTADLIERCTTDAREGAAHVHHVTGAMRTLTTDVGRIRALVTDVTHASQQQAQGIAEVTRAIGQMEQVTQHNATAAQETADTAAALTTEAESSLRLVTQLESLVAGRPASIHRPTSTAAQPDFTRSQERAPMHQRAA